MPPTDSPDFSKTNRYPMTLLITSICLLLLAITAPANAFEPVVVRLWPHGAPESEGFKIEPEKEVQKKSENDVRRLTNVSDPTITIYRPEKQNGTTVIVAPGGGYSILAIEHEGTQVCEYLNSLGITCALLKYRVPARERSNPSQAPLQDAQRAIGILRNRASEWRIHPNRIGILGFSAGGHLAVMMTLHPNERTYTPNPELDVTDATPNFAVPVYPAYLVEKENPGQLRPEIAVTKKAPPICIIHANDDRGATSAAGSALLYLEYKKRNISAELHIYAKGGHGFGMRKTGLPTAEWLVRVGEWMGSIGLLTP
jgi:acetyl esterase/lipase